MYSNNISKVKIGAKLSSAFPVDIGVRQGCVLSPTLFNIYISDVIKEISNNSVDMPEVSDNNPLPCLAWVDDIVLFSLTKIQIQSQLNRLAGLFNSNCLKINVKKT